MTDKRRIYPEELNREAVRLVSAQCDGVAAVARHLGRNARMRGRWKRAVEQTMHGAFPGHGRVSLEQEEVSRWREEHRRWRMAREIFKNALGFFASESKCDRPSSCRSRRPGRVRCGVRCGTSVGAALTPTPRDRRRRGGILMRWPGGPGGGRCTQRRGSVMGVGAGLRRSRLLAFRSDGTKHGG
jgi:transposase-like protein